MPKRVRQHELEDLSRSKFSLAVPRNWVCRDKNKDYGIDVEVEIFDKDGRATGLVFWVQLKATESNDKAVIKNINLSIESIKYYKSLEIPVLIVRYSEKQNSFYYRWAHEIDLFYAKKNAKNMRISFGKEDTWNKDSHIKIEEYLGKIRAIKKVGINLPISVYIDAKDKTVNGIPKGVFISSCRIAFREYPEFAVLQNVPQGALLNATLSGDELKINLLSVSGCTFHSIKSRKGEGLAEGIAADILLGASIALTRIGQSEVAARIVLDRRLKSRFIEKHDVLLALIPYLLRTNYFGAAIDAIADAINVENDNNIIEFITLSSIYDQNILKDEEKAVKVEDFLRNSLDKYIALGSNSNIGAFYYNLGNHYSARGLLQNAIIHYLKARRYHKKYVKQIYYLRELGGCLFLYKKYHFSAMLYKMALDEGAPESVKTSYADALMFSGKYQSALDVFTEYLKSSKAENDEWHLKKICLELLIERTGIKEQTRHSSAALESIRVRKNDRDARIKSLEKAIELDMLCGLAWFNLGVEHSNSGEHENAAYSFIICGLVQNGDVEAWVNATICSLNKVVPVPIFALILRTAYFYNRDNYLKKVYEELNKKGASEFLDLFSSAVEEILPRTQVGKRNPIIRIMGKDGVFRNIFDEDKA